MDMLRFATAGSVDDGKSTLIGRLLYDSKSVFEDQIDAVEAASRSRGDEYTNLALLTDGLRAEREQGITIDVAYRYFATPVRKFIIADTPGHAQYTRNMVTGMSTADVAIVLVDAEKGLIEQGRRHTFLISLLGLRHIVVCVNKMDLVEYDREVFESIRADFMAFAAKLNVPDVTFIPICARDGDNIVHTSPNMPWYAGNSLLHHLEQVYVGADRNLVDFRFPVQYVIRPQSTEYRDYRGYAGKIASGSVRVGDEVVHLPSGLTTTVTAIDRHHDALAEATAEMSVTLRFADELDISRGDMICRPNNVPAVTQDVEVMLAWMGDKPMRPGTEYLLKHTSQTARAQIRELRYRLDINTLHRDPEAPELRRNEIGRVRLRITRPIFGDLYARNRATGALILIDPATNNTVAMGMINETR
jgi:bifunctional enzyme CysN/CysC